MTASSAVTVWRLIISGLGLAGLVACSLNLRGALQDWRWLRGSGLDGLKSKIARAHIERALSRLFQGALLSVTGIAGLWLEVPNKASRALWVGLSSLALVTLLILVGALRDLQHRHDMLRRS